MENSLWVVMMMSSSGLSSLVWQRQTYGSNSAGGRDGADGAGALSEGVSEHIERVLYVHRMRRKTIAIDLQLCGEEIDGRGVALFGPNLERKKSKKLRWLAPTSGGPATDPLVRPSGPESAPIGQSCTSMRLRKIP